MTARMSMNFLKGAVFAALGVFAMACSAADKGAASYTLGKEFKEVHEVQKPADPKRITVEEFFWYGCPHCFHLDPEVTAWAATKPSDVDFTRVPNTLGRPEGEIHSRAFFIAQSLGILDKTHKALFDAIHVQHYPMSSLDSIRALYVEVAGIKPADFDGLANSFVIDSGLGNAQTLSRNYGITGVPTIVVGGKYAVGAQEDTFKVVNFVIDKIRKERKG